MKNKYDNKLTQSWICNSIDTVYYYVYDYVEDK